MSEKICVFWFRRDLRLHDNAGLLQALRCGYKVLPIFIFDKIILDKLPKDDARVTFIFETLQQLNTKLKSDYGSLIELFYGYPHDIFTEICQKYEVVKVFTNHDYEPYAKERDTKIKKLLLSKNIAFTSFKDQVVYEKNDIVKADGSPYVVYTPYKNKWKEKFNASYIKPHNTLPYCNNLIKQDANIQIALHDLGFTKSIIQVPTYNVNPNLIENYEDTRNFPGISNGTSHLGPHLRFGTVSIREMMQKAIAEKNEVFWNELIWREFFMQILWHFPYTVRNSFRPKYDRIEWRNNEFEFDTWKNGSTGYPLVDAGMRELNATGYMHNRVRMLVASFLCKHLLIDWRWGETYFAEKLLDYDLSANIGNWQWAAGSGVDAAPYFRIFNPTTQVKKFDKEHSYIKKWVPEFQELTYPKPMVDHKMARERCLKIYKEAVA